MRLTDISLRSLRPQSGQYAVLDDLLPNFGVRVGTTGRLSFFVLYRIDGRRKKAGDGMRSRRPRNRTGVGCRR